MTPGGGKEPVSLEYHDAGVETLRDAFESAAFSNNDGTSSFLRDWVESDSYGPGAASGYIQIIGGALALMPAQDATESTFVRAADLTDVTTAVLRFDFTTSDRKAHATVGAFAAAAVATLASLSSEGKLDSILGDRIRAKVTSTGTYAGSTNVSVRAVAR